MTDKTEGNDALSIAKRNTQRAKKKKPSPQADSGAIQPDFFELDLPIAEYAFKDDIESMEAPVFSLSTRSDLKVHEWKNADGSKIMRITPSVVGRATIFDKDVLIYAASQLIASQNKGEVISKTIRFVAADFFTATGGSSGGDDYRRFFESLDRLAGTRLNIHETSHGGSRRQTDGFGLIDTYRVISEEVGQRKVMTRVEITLSDWLFTAIQKLDVITINPAYFLLRKAIERRIYEIVRKHCGQQPTWKISLAMLKDKCGSTSPIRNFRGTIRDLCAAQSIPDYLIRLDEEDYFHAIPKAIKTLR